HQHERGGQHESGPAGHEVPELRLSAAVGPGDDERANDIGGGRSRGEAERTDHCIALGIAVRMALAITLGIALGRALRSAVGIAVSDYTSRSRRRAARPLCAGSPTCQATSTG